MARPSQSISGLVLIRSLFCLLLVIVFFGGGSVEAALLPFTENDLRKVIEQQNFRDPEDRATCGPSLPSVTPGGGKIYMIGDSITEGSASQLSSSFQESDFSSVIDGLASRRLSTGNDPKDGLSVLEKSADQYNTNSGVTVVIIALGTNGGITATNIRKAIQTVKDANAEARIFWVNIGVDNDLRDGDDLPATGWNASLQASSSELGYTVIDWAKALTGHSNYLVADGLGVHPNDEGKVYFASTVLNALGSNITTTTCSGRELIGSDNQERAFNYFVEQGLLPFQAAGIVGNMIAESGVLPTRLQATPPEQVTPSASILDKLTEGIGWGIVQWTPPGKIIKNSNDRGIAYEQIDTLAFQLEFLWGQLTGTGIGGESSNEKPAGDHLRATVNVAQAAASFANKYERCANCQEGSSEIRDRIELATDVLNRYGSGL